MSTVPFGPPAVHSVRPSIDAECPSCKSHTPPSRYRLAPTVCPQFLVLRDKLSRNRAIDPAEAATRGRAMCGCDICRSAMDAADREARVRREAEQVAQFVRDAYERIFRDDEEDGMPAKAHEGLIVHRLLDLDYSEAEVWDVLCHCRQFGTAEMAPHLSEGDKTIVEALLPEVVANWNRSEFAGHWALNL